MSPPSATGRISLSGLLRARTPAPTITARPRTSVSTVQLQHPHLTFAHFQSNDLSKEDAANVDTMDISISVMNVNDDTVSTDFHLSEAEIQDSVLKIQQTRFGADSGTAQAQSPTIKVSLHNNQTEAIVDEGATINCMALKFAKSSNIDIVDTSSKARGADSSSLRVVGRTMKTVRLVTTGLYGIPIVLQNVIVVDGLSADILIGEPGKGYNKIITK